MLYISMRIVAALPANIKAAFAFLSCSIRAARLGISKWRIIIRRILRGSNIKCGSEASGLAANALSIGNNRRESQYKYNKSLALQRHYSAALRR